MTALGCDSVIFDRNFEVLLDAAAVLEPEAEIVCAVRMALVGSALIEVGCKGQIFVSADAALQADPKTVLGSRISLFSGQAEVFRRAKRVSADPFPYSRQRPRLNSASEWPREAALL
jgi:hypothetical protein